GREDEASSSIAQAGELGAWGVREHLGMFWLVCSIIQRRSPGLESQSRERARRIWREQGNACAAQDSEALSLESKRVTAPEEMHAESHLGARLASSLASAFDLSHDALLLA